jgi:iron complex outermembrane receptor protein
MIPTFLIPGSNKLRFILKSVIIYIALLFPLLLQGQISLQTDTILIKEVEIRGKSVWQEYSGSKTTHIDSSMLTDYYQLSLADLIAGNSTVYIKTYGSGGLATPSFRGTGSGHTLITWNNVNLNNPMVGQFDLSLVPAGFLDDINILYGGGSMNINSGGFGGIIDLETKPDWNSQNILYLNPSIGSFGRYSGLVKVKAGTTGFQSVTKAFFVNSDNDYRYLNSVSGQIPFWEIRKNNQVNQYGFIQELYLRNPRSTYSAKFWYQSAFRNLPVPIINPTMSPPERQNDESLRAMVTYNSLIGITDINFTAAFISDKLEYTNKIASVNSRNSSKRIVMKGDLERRINEKMEIKFAFNDELDIVKTNNYAGDKISNVASVDAIAEADFTRWLVVRLLIRETLQDSRLLSPDFLTSAEIKPFPEKYYFVKASLSKNSRIPTLNDMYWTPGGNPDLKNESGYASEITWEMTHFLSNSFKIKNDLTLFGNHLSNVIQWHPGEFSYWEADNISNIVTAGLESSVDINYFTSRFNARLNAGYAFTRASSNGIYGTSTLSGGKQLIYNPVHLINILLRFNWQHFYSSITSNYTGKRFLTADNFQYLPPYSVSDIHLGLRFNTGNASYDAGIIIENIFNVNYQNIAYYPAPGRNYLLTVIFQFKK